MSGWLLLLLVGAIALAVPPDPEDRPFEEVGSDEVPEPSNQYLTKKDARNIAIGLAGLALVLFPVWLLMKGNSDQYYCLQNFKAMGTSMLSYETNYDDRLPPTYARSDDSSLPRLDDKGRAFTWASTLVNLAGFDHKRSFRCPSAPDDALMTTEGLNGETLAMSYGMYAGLDVANTRDIDDPGYAILIAETSNGGAENSYDPHPIKVGGKFVDSFLIGWGTGDDVPPTDPKKFGDVTRIAFKNTPHGLHGDLTLGRHDLYLDVLFADGHAGALKGGNLANARHWPVISHP